MLPVIIAATLALLFLAAGRPGAHHAAAGRLVAMRRARGGPECEPAGPTARRAPTPLFERLARLLPSRLHDLLGSGLEKHAGRAGQGLEPLVGMRAAGMVALPVAAVLLSGLSYLSLAAAPAGSALGFVLPSLLASRRYGRYLDSLKAALPGVADILYASVLGGRNLDQAFRSATSAAAEPLRTVLGSALVEIELGASHAEAFERLLERCPLPELAALLRSLLESEKKGYPLSRTLEVFSRDIRLKRRDELRAKAARAPVKLLAPLVFLILPASVILTVGPTFLVALKRGF